MIKDTTLKELLSSGKTLIMPDAYDPISAKIIEYAGFSAIQCSGYSYSISKGFESEDNIDLVTNLKITKEIVNAVNIPVMADGEDGYGENNDLELTIKEFMNIGVSGINIEDKNHAPNTTKSEIVEENKMLNKIKLAVRLKDKLDKKDFIINSRTDALLTCTNRRDAQKVAIERANAYLESGADMCFLAYVETLDEVKLFAKEINGRISIALGLPYNIEKINIKDCIELGIARVSLPIFMIINSIGGMIKNIENLKKSWSFDEAIKENEILLNQDVLKNILGVSR